MANNFAVPTDVADPIMLKRFLRNLADTVGGLSEAQLSGGSTTVTRVINNNLRAVNWGSLVGDINLQTDLIALLATKLGSGDNISELVNDLNYVLTAANMGSGVEIFKQKTNDELEYRSLLAGSAITLTQGANDILIAVNLAVLDGLYEAKKSVTVYSADANMSITSEYHIDADDDSWTADRSIKLPSTPSNGDEYVVSKAGSSYNVIIDGNGKNINGSTTQTLVTQYSCLAVRYTGSEWRVC